MKNSEYKLPILYNDKGDCCGCTACCQSCPLGAISMRPDNEGFLYPVIDETKCIRCNKCLTVCSFKKRKHTI